MSNVDEAENNFTVLVAFVRDQIGEFDMPITRDTLIENGLGVTGDEAVELIISFGKKYNVDITSFDFGKYFYDEPGPFNLPTKKIEPLTIGHLEKAILAQRLDEQVINS